MSTDDSGERLAPLTASAMGTDVARDDARLKVTDPRAKGAPTRTA